MNHWSKEALAELSPPLHHYGASICVRDTMLSISLVIITLLQAIMYKI